MSASVTIKCDVCDVSSGAYGWQSVTECRRDMRDSGWRRLTSAQYRKLMGYDPLDNRSLDICQACYRMYAP